MRFYRSAGCGRGGGAAGPATASATPGPMLRDGAWDVGGMGRRGGETMHSQLLADEFLDLSNVLVVGVGDEAGGATTGLDACGAADAVDVVIG